MRRRFTNSLRWYYELRNAAEVRFQGLLDDARSCVPTSPPDHVSRPTSPLTPFLTSPVKFPPPRILTTELASRTSNIWLDVAPGIKLT